MQITLTARHFDLTEAHKNHAEQEIKRLTRYFDHIISADMIITLEKYRYTAELNLQVDRAMLTSKEEAAELYPAIDTAASKMERQLKKYNSKLHDRRIKREA